MTAALLINLPIFAWLAFMAVALVTLGKVPA
jgi:hypothetical protein